MAVVDGVRIEVGVGACPDGSSYVVAAFIPGNPARRADARPIEAAFGAVAAYAVGVLRG